MGAVLTEYVGTLVAYELFLQTLVNGIVLSVIYVLIASGITLIFGIMRMVNFTHGVIYTIGGFSVYVFSVQLGLNYFIALPVTIILLSLIGAVVERTTVRPVQSLGTMPCFIVNLGLLLVLEGSLLIGFGPKDRVVPSVVSGTLWFAGVVLSYERLLIVVAGAALVVAMYAMVHKTKFGLALQAVQQDGEATCLLGINPIKYRSLAFIIGFGLAGAAGGLIAPLFLVNTGMGNLPLVKAFVIIILGGMGSMSGAVLGGLILGFTESFVGTFVNTEIADMIGFIVLIAVLVFRPRGLLGKD